MHVLYFITWYLIIYYAHFVKKLNIPFPLSLPFRGSITLRVSSSKFLLLIFTLSPCLFFSLIFYLCTSLSLFLIVSFSNSRLFSLPLFHTASFSLHQPFSLSVSLFLYVSLFILSFFFLSRFLHCLTSVYPTDISLCTPIYLYFCPPFSNSQKEK